MPAVSGLVALFLICAGGATALSPVQKVINLLEEYKAKVVSDLAAEEKAMAEYADFCDSETSEKGYEIKTASKKITMLGAEIEDGNAQIASLNSDVASIGTAMAEKEKQLDEAELVRSSEKAAFSKSEEELISSVDDLERATLEIKKSSSEAGLIQVKGRTRVSKPTLKDLMSALSKVVDASWVNAADRRQIQGLMQTSSDEDDGDDLRLSAPKAEAYDSATGGIVETLEEMKEKAESALTEARNTETRQQHSFDMMAQSLTDAIAQLKKKLSDTKTGIATATQEVGENGSELMETKKNKKANDAYLTSLTMDCTEAREAWAARQEDAKAEIGALSKAKEILSTRVRVLLQVGANTEAVSSVDGDERTREAVVAKLKTLSKKFSSFALMEMVSAAAADPFEKIKGLIEGMIAKLIEEANQAATQKSFCDEEISKSKESQSEKSMDMDKLKSRLDTATSKKAELEGDVAELQAEIADLDKATSEATSLRAQEKADYQKASADMKEAAEAVEEAISTLKEYYEGASLAQLGRGSKQPTFGSKKSDAGSTIISILEMCGEDFSKSYMQMQQEEATAEAAYKKLSLESKVAKAAKLAEIKGAQSEIKSLDVAVKSHKEDIDMTSQELDAVMTYLEKLKPQCESTAMSYTEKKSRREAEISGLKEALSILEGAALLQTKVNPSLRGA